MKKRILNIILLILIIISTIGVLIYKKRRGKDILQHPKFTVGKISSEWHSKTTFKQPGFDFKYKIGDTESQAVTNELKATKIGNSYLLIYDSLNPSAVSFLAIYPLPDSIKAPKNGWKLNELPIEIDWKRIEEYVLSR